MLIYSAKEIVLLTLAAIVIDWLVGDPRPLPHPVVAIGRLIHRIERALRRPELSRRSLQIRGVILTLVTITVSAGTTWVVTGFADWLHPWLGYTVSAWLISTTIAVKGLKDAAYEVYGPLLQGSLPEARTKVGYIVGRDTANLDEREIARATIETVAENTVDAFVSPIVFALLGGAPLAMAYRAANTLDSMVGYKNEKYLHFGWASARLDDVLNWIPARLTGHLLAAVALVRGGSGAVRNSYKAVLQFAHRHPSPNSGIPESAVAGAIGIELGGCNTYGGVVSDRARMGWPRRPIETADIAETVRFLYGVSFILAGGLACCAWIVW